MTGLSRDTLHAIDERARIAQAIGDILTTPLGTRVGVGAYGSMLFDMVGQPGTASGLQRLRAATVDAIRRWEAAVHIRRVEIVAGGDGKTAISVYGDADFGPVSATVSLPASPAPTSSETSESQENRGAA